MFRPSLFLDAPYVGDKLPYRPVTSEFPEAIERKSRAFLIFINTTTVLFRQTQFLRAVNLRTLSVTLDVLVRTLLRGLTIRFFLIDHEEWFTRLAVDIFGSKHGVREAQNDKTNLHNAFTACLHHLRSYGPDGVRLWDEISDATKMQWRALDKSMNLKSHQELKKIMRAFEVAMCIIKRFP